MNFTVCDIADDNPPQPREIIVRLDEAIPGLVRDEFAIGEDLLAVLTGDGDRKQIGDPLVVSIHRPKKNAT